MSFHYLKVANNCCKIEAVMQRCSTKNVFWKFFQNSQENPCLFLNEVSNKKKTQVSESCTILVPAIFRCCWYHVLPLIIYAISIALRILLERNLAVWGDLILLDKMRKSFIMPMTNVVPLCWYVLHQESLVSLLRGKTKHESKNFTYETFPMFKSRSIQIQGFFNVLSYQITHFAKTGLQITTS